MTDLDLAAVTFEPCWCFAGDETGTAVCDCCGWLADDHDTSAGPAPVRRLRLPAAAPRGRTRTRRLAS